MSTETYHEALLTAANRPRYEYGINALWIAEFSGVMDLLESATTDELRRDEDSRRGYMRSRQKLRQVKDYPSEYKYKIDKNKIYERIRQKSQAERGTALLNRIREYDAVHGEGAYREIALAGIRIEPGSSHMIFWDHD